MPSFPSRSSGVSQSQSQSHFVPSSEFFQAMLANTEKCRMLHLWSRTEELKVRFLQFLCWDEEKKIGREVIEKIAERQIDEITGYERQNEGWKNDEPIRTFIQIKKKQWHLEVILNLSRRADELEGLNDRMIEKVRKLRRQDERKWESFKPQGAYIRTVEYIFAFMERPRSKNDALKLLGLKRPLPDIQTNIDEIREQLTELQLQNARGPEFYAKLDELERVGDDLDQELIERQSKKDMDLINVTTSLRNVTSTPPNNRKTSSVEEIIATQNNSPLIAALKTTEDRECDADHSDNEDDSEENDLFSDEEENSAEIPQERIQENSQENFHEDFESNFDATDSEATSDSTESSLENESLLLKFHKDHLICGSHDEELIFLYNEIWVRDQYGVGFGPSHSLEDPSSSSSSASSSITRLPEMPSGWKLPDQFGTFLKPISNGDIIVDLGANVGMFSSAALVQGAKMVFAVEPIPDNYYNLFQNLKKISKDVSVNNVERAVVAVESNGAVGTSSHQRKSSENSEKSHESILRILNQDKERVKQNELERCGQYGPGYCILPYVGISNQNIDSAEFTFYYDAPGESTRYWMEKDYRQQLLQMEKGKSSKQNGGGNRKDRNGDRNQQDRDGTTTGKINRDDDSDEGSSDSPDSPDRDTYELKCITFNKFLEDFVYPRLEELRTIELKEVEERRLIEMCEAARRYDYQNYLYPVSIDLCKIDIEGDELNALMGLKEEDWKRIKQFVIEVANVEDTVCSENLRRQEEEEGEEQGREIKEEEKKVKEEEKNIKEEKKNVKENKIKVPEGKTVSSKKVSGEKVSNEKTEKFGESVSQSRLDTVCGILFHNGFEFEVEPVEVDDVVGGYHMCIPKSLGLYIVRARNKDWYDCYCRGEFDK